MNAPTRRAETDPLNYGRTRECARRLRQIQRGQLRGSAVSDEARLAAIGLAAPEADALIQRVSVDARGQLSLD